MRKGKDILGAIVLTALLLPGLAAAEPSSAPAGITAAEITEMPVCSAALAELGLPELPALPDQPAEPIYAACDWTCADRCDGYYASCVQDCPGFRGDPCLTSCRSGRISCYQSCGCL